VIADRPRRTVIDIDRDGVLNRYIIF